ncbi:MAG: hypothetical protein KDC54_02705, partial [Lewinella sp.]|nr:hypothetical protein [Lewinella sp.]
MDYTEYSDLFTNLDSRESIFIWMVILVSFLLGFIIAYLLRTARVRAVKRELREAVEKQQAAEAQLATFQTQLEARNAELQAESREKVDLMDRVNQLELEKKNHYNEVYELNQRIEALESTNQSYSATIDDLNSQLVNLKAQGDQASTTPLGATAPAMEKESQDALQNRLAELEAQMTRL